MEGAEVPKGEVRCPDQSSSGSGLKPESPYSLLSLGSDRCEGDIKTLLLHCETRAASLRCPGGMVQNARLGKHF